MKDNYFELTITLKNDFVEFIADFILNIYGEGLELGEGQIIVRSESDLSFVKEALIALEGTLGGSINMEYFLQEKENVNWIKKYQDSVQPIEAGEFYIYPSWFEPKEGFINIKIDPTLAFGSGHHETTFACLEAISHYVKDENIVIDVGCGSGILGLASRKLGASVDLCDTDIVSVDSTKENFSLNNETYEKLWEGSVNQAEDKYDVVIANIIVDVLKILAKDLKSSCKKDGIIILSGILDKKEDQILEAYQELKLLQKVQKNEWVTLIYQNTN